MRIESIGDNEHFEYKGNLQILGSIGKNATVIVKDGSLTVDGNVGAGSDISMQSTATGGGSVVISGGSIFVGAGSSVSMGGGLVSIGGGQASYVSVRGHVENDVKISTRNASITVGGNIGSNASIDTSNASIRAADIGNGATLTTKNASIDVARVNPRATLKTTNANINAGDAGEGSTLKTSNGNISVRNAHPTASLQTTNGEIYENGVPRKTARPSDSSSTVVFAGGSVFMSGGNVRVGGRMIVNGVDITDIVNGRAGAQPAQQQEEQPVRYMKKGM